MTGENARHAGVLRLGSKDRIVICNGNCYDYLCEIRSVSRNSLELAVLEENLNQSEPNVRVRLYPALIKSDKLEYVVQKAVELGADSIVPFQSENSVARISKNSRENFNQKTERLEKIAESAAKQSGRGVIPFLSPPLTFSEALAEVSAYNPQIFLAAHEKAETGLKAFLSKLKTLENISAAIFIGPEGGFSQSECEAFRLAGAGLFSLGKRVLRAETAALAALACLIYELENT